MTDSSIVTSGMARSILVDSSVYDSRMAETTKDHGFLGPAMDDAEDMLPRLETRIILVGEASRNDLLIQALKDINKPCLMTDSVQEFADGENAEFESVYVLASFDSPDYSYLYKRDNRIVGPPVILHCAAKEEPLPFSCRPLYSTTMINLSLCFTGFRDKEEVKTLVNLVHHMGGTIRKDFSTKVTHLIAYSTHGEKYKLAVCMGTPILTPSWIRKAWDSRDYVSFQADDEKFRTDFKVPPFQDCVLSFLGFSEEDKANMEERTLKHGGTSLELGDERCTHMVVEENSVKELPFTPTKKLYVVKQEWFWGSIQMDARAGESMYFYEKDESPAMKKAESLLSLNTPNSNRKRRRLRDTLAQLTKQTEISPFPPPRKRPSAEHSMSMGSLLDISNTPDNCKTLAESSKPNKSSTPMLTKQSARWQVTKELYQTESNYVDILNTILKLFKIPLEKEGQVGGPILAQEEIKTIFGSIPDIYDVHRKIKADLEELLNDWSEDKSIGNIILKYSKEMLKTYPSFVNFFEMSKDTIVKCEKLKPRFHAFLKINQSKPECGRQTLVELLIRPVQRLPSVGLLLNDIKKHTSDDNPDKRTLERAIEALKEVMTHINEDKRKTEGQKQIFDVVYEVDGCPANLLSSHRSLVHRVETIALGDQPCDRGEQVTLFLFNDCLEIARKRHKVISTFKSPVGQTRPPAQLKHIMLMPLSQIRKVLDLQDTEECVNAFALVVHPPTEQENLLFSFQLTGEETVKSDWLRTLCRHVANTICRADSDDLIQRTSPEPLQVSTKDMDSTLSKASRAIKKTSKKVTRVFSFNKTPKRVIQRAFMANGTTEERSPRLSAESRFASSSTLAMSRSASTFSLSDSAKNSAIVQRSNSLDHPPLRSRVSICVRDPCSPAPNPPPSATSTSARPSPQAATGTGALAGSQSPGLPSSRVSLLLKPAPQAPRTQSNPRFPTATSGHRSPSSSPRSRVPASLRAPHLNLKPTDTARRSVRQAPPAVYQARVSVLVPHLTSYARGGNPSGGSGRDAPPADPRKPGPTGPRRETLL
ncbi:protein ECT2 isoform X2 [Gadus macrocephalus]|uniref:protein ECT2 isoform X2 n=1 Tax=Gadus macrocephalus TaxID=80720 RepID=UPI0028CBB0E3|nr:protein ECT2 isoform X2 [Gadus macrocephalus]